jgi:hypothetical protein
MLKSKQTQIKIENGDISLSNASDANKYSKGVKDQNVLDDILTKASELSNRKFNE